MVRVVAALAMLSAITSRRTLSAVRPVAAMFMLEKSPIAYLNTRFTRLYWAEIAVARVW